MLTNKLAGLKCGEDELSSSKPYIGDGNCSSWANKAVFDIPIEDGINMLTNQKDGIFTISELEVWSVKEMEQE